MNILITVTVPFVTTLGPFVSSSGSSYLRLCDGPTDLVLGGNTYRANLLQNISEYQHSVNLFKGGNLEQVANFAFKMEDNNLAESLEIAGNSLNGGTVQLSRLLDDGTTVEPLWFGYVNTTEIKDNLLSVNCVTVRYAMSNFKTPQAWGFNSKIPLQIDPSMSGQEISFLSKNGDISQSPRIIATYSTQNPGTAGTITKNYGVLQNKSSTPNVSILIGHYNDIFEDLGATSGTLIKAINGSTYYYDCPNILVNWLTGDSANTGISYRIQSIVRVVDPSSGGEYQTLLIFKDTSFGSIDIRAFDRISIKKGISFYLIDPSFASKMNGVYFKDNNEYYGLNEHSWSIETIGGKSYLAVFSSSNVYSEVPITLSVSAETQLEQNNLGVPVYTLTKGTPSTINYGSGTTDLDTDPITDNDLTTFFTCINNMSLNCTTNTVWAYSNLAIDMVPDLTNYSGKDLYFGALVDRPTQLANLKHSFNTYLNSGDVFPCEADGMVSFGSPINSYGPHASTSVTNGYLNCVPMGGISYPDNILSDNVNILPSGWSIEGGSGWNAVFANGVYTFVHPSASNGNRVVNLTPLPIGHTYIFDVTISNLTAGDVRIELGSQFFYGKTQSEIIIATTLVDGVNLAITPNGFVGSVSIKVYELNTVTPSPYTVITGYGLNPSYYPSISNPTSFYTFNQSQMLKIPVDPKTYSDIDHFRYSLLSDYGVKSDTARDPLIPLIYKVGIWAKVTIDNEPTIYIDIDSKTNSTGKPDSTAKAIITEMGDSVTSDFATKLTSYDYDDLTTSNHYSVRAKSNTKEALADLAIENQIVIGQSEDGTWYTQLLDQTQVEASIQYSIPSNQIFEIMEPLKDIDITNIVNLPKFSFKSLNGEDETLEVIDLDQALPTLETFLNNPACINANFDFSENFISKVTEYSNIMVLYNLILSPIWNTCKASYTKNGITQGGNIDIKTTYLEYILRTVDSGSPVDTPTYIDILDCNSAGWSFPANNWYGSQNVFSHSVGSTVVLSNPATGLLTIGQDYQIIWTCTFNTGTNCTITVGGATFNNLSNGYTVLEFTATSTAGMVLIPTSTFNGLISVTLNSVTHHWQPVQVNTNLPTNITKLVTMLSQRRKTVTLSVPSVFKNAQLGGRVKIFDPRLMQNNTLFGFIIGVNASFANEAYVKLTILCDSYKLGNGQIDFF